MIRAALISLTLAAPAAAQGTFDVPRHFEMFDRFCRPALQGIEAFKAVVTVPGPTGEQVFSVTPDGYVIDAKTGVEGFLISASFFYGPDSVMRFCQVENLEVMGTQRAVTEPAFLAAAPNGDGIKMFGGPRSEELPGIGSFALAGVGNIKSVRSQYTFFGATEPPGSIMGAYIGDNIFILNATAILKRQ